jgi:hypothetical protein
LKKIGFAMLSFLVGAVMVFSSFSTVRAGDGDNEKVTICHDGETQVIPKDDQNKDQYKPHTDGACPTPPPDEEKECEWNHDLHEGDDECQKPPEEHDEDEKVIICLNGVTLEIDKKHEDKDEYDGHTDGACPTLPDPVPGCMNDHASNYNPLATVDNKTCLFDQYTLTYCLNGVTETIDWDASELAPQVPEGAVEGACVPPVVPDEPTPAPAPQVTGAGGGLPWTLPVGFGLMIVGLGAFSLAPKKKI